MSSIDGMQQIRVDLKLREFLKVMPAEIRKQLDERETEFSLKYTLLWLNVYLPSALNDAGIDVDDEAVKEETERAVRNMRLHLDDSVTAENSSSLVDD